jgi:hypothetical protein
MEVDDINSAELLPSGAIGGYVHHAVAAFGGAHCAMSSSFIPHPSREP